MPIDLAQYEEDPPSLADYEEEPEAAEEIHPEITTGQLVTYRSWSTRPEQIQRDLEKRGFLTAQNEQGYVLVKRPGEGSWKFVNKPGFDVSDFAALPGEAVSLAGYLGGTGIGAMAGGGGAIPGGVLGGAAGEAIRAKIGQQLGLDVTGGDIATQAAVGGVAGLAGEVGGRLVSAGVRGLAGAGRAIVGKFGETGVGKRLVPVTERVRQRVGQEGQKGPFDLAFRAKEYGERLIKRPFLPATSRGAIQPPQKSVKEMAEEFSGLSDEALRKMLRDSGVNFVDYMTPIDQLGRQGLLRVLTEKQIGHLKGPGGRSAASVIPLLRGNAGRFHPKAGWQSPRVASIRGMVTSSGERLGPRELARLTPRQAIGGLAGAGSRLAGFGPQVGAGIANYVLRGALRRGARRAVTPGGLAGGAALLDVAGALPYGGSLLGLHAVSGGLRRLQERIMGDVSGRALADLATQAPGGVKAKIRRALAILRSRGEDFYRVAVWQLMRDAEFQEWARELDKDLAQS